MNSTLIRLTGPIALLLIAGLASQPLLAQDLRGELESAARKIDQMRKQVEAPNVAVGEFHGGDQYTKGTGARVQAKLIEILKGAKIDIAEKSHFKVSGSFQVVVVKKGSEFVIPDNVVIKIKIQIEHGNEKLATLVKTITERKNGNEDILNLTGRAVTLRGKENADPGQRNQAIADQLSNPPAPKLLGSRIRLKDGSPYEIEILAGPAGKGNPRKERLAFVKNDLPHVNLEKGEEYLIRIHNTSSSAVVANVLIDGVDRYTFFAPANARPGALLIPANKHVDVRGFRISMKTEKAFLVGSILDSAAFKDPKLKDQLARLTDYRGLAGSSDIGLIKVAIRPFWKKGEEPTGGYRDVGTGLGREIDSPAVYVEGTIGPVVEQIVIRYEKKH